MTKFEIKDTTVTYRFASYLELHIEIDREEWLRTKLFDKRDVSNFLIVNFPFVYSNIPTVYVYIDLQVYTILKNLWFLSRFT